MPTAQQIFPRALSSPPPRTRPPVVLFSAFDPADQLHWPPLSVASATAPGESPARVGRKATSTSDPAPSSADVSERVDGGVDLPELHCQPLLPLGVTTGGAFVLSLAPQERVVHVDRPVPNPSVDEYPARQIEFGGCPQCGGHMDDQDLYRY
jgi:hypothetical protein